LVGSNTASFPALSICFRCREIHSCRLNGLPSDLSVSTSIGHGSRIVPAIISRGTARRSVSWLTCCKQGAWSGASPGQKMWGGHAWPARGARAYNGVWGRAPKADSTPSGLPSKNSPDLHQSQERPLAKVGWTCPPKSTPWRRPCTWSLSVANFQTGQKISP